MQALEQLRNEFVADTVAQVHEMRSWLARLAEGQDRDALRELNRSFHHLAGTGGAFGFPEVTELAREANEEGKILLQSNRPIVSDEVDTFAQRAERILQLVCGSCNKCSLANGRCEKPPAASGERLIEIRSSVADRPRVLSVEDDPAQAAWLRAVLENAGYEYVHCATICSFDEMLRDSCPDLLLLDVDLPGGNGFELARALRATQQNAALPIVFLTVDRGEDVRLRALGSGADDYITKPAAPELLLSAIDGRIRRSRATRAMLERDGLTGLLTRNAFMNRLSAVAGRLDRNSNSGAVLAVIDLDHFKLINDRYGHPTGDAVLQAMAEVFRYELRRADFAGRYGGEEFVVLLEGPTANDAVSVCERLLAHFRSVVHRGPGGVGFQATFSTGVAPYPLARGKPARWLAAADRAVYRAKAAGRNRVFVANSYDSQMLDAVRDAESGADELKRSG